MIYFYVYPSAFQNPGGGEILLLKTKQYLEELGVNVRLFDQWQHRFQSGDLLHVFGSVKEALGLMETAKSKGVRIVHSPIIWYNWRSAFGIEYSFRERLTCVIRQFSKSVLPAIPSARKRMMKLADVVLAGSEAEAHQIARYFLIPKKDIRVVTYGTDEYFSSADRNLFIKKYGIQNFTLVVGRIEPRKNHLNLIRAMNKVSRELVVIGDPVSHHMNYYQQCRKEAGASIKFLGSLPRDSEELRAAYAACDVFALPSWFETPGLSALEAGLAGAKIVITADGSTQEYFKDMAEYVRPARVSNIRNKIQKALMQPKTNILKTHIQTNYLWRHTARQTLDIYQALKN